ncbi:MAG: outer membrane beta-barrel protein [Deltaproteobacteria bacterium]|nr:outer membrane beta-barrel protein [Deltaproteobacteria bacterium]
MRKKLVFLLLGCFVLLLAGQPVLAAVEQHLNVSVTTGAEYDDNIYLDPDHEEDDVNFTITPSINWLAAVEHASLSVTYTPGINSYVDDSSNNYISHDVNVVADWQPLQYLAFKFTEHYLHSEDPLDDRDSRRRDEEDSRLNDRQGRDPYYRNDVGLTGTYTFGDQRFFDLGYRFGLLQNENPDDTDSREHSVSSHLGFKVSDHDMLDLSYVFTRGIYKHDPDDFVSHDVTGRYTRTITPHLDVYGQLGFLHYDYDSSSEEDNYDEYSGDLGVTYRFREYYTFGASYGRYDHHSKGDDDNSGNRWSAYLQRDFENKSFRVAFDYGTEVNNFDAENNGYTKYWSLMADFNYHFAERWSLTANGTYRNDDYQDEEPSYEQDEYMAGVTLSYAINDWLSAAASYNYDELDSDRDEDDYVDNRVMFSLTARWNVF